MGNAERKTFNVENYWKEATSLQPHSKPWVYQPPDKVLFLILAMCPMEFELAKLHFYYSMLT